MRSSPDLEAWVAGALPRLLGLAHAMTGSRAEAEDLVQETLAKLIASWGRASSADHVDAYVRRMLVNTWISHRRRRWTRELVSHAVVTADRAVPSFPGHGDLLGQREELVGALRGLPPRQRAALALRYYDDLSDTAIAEALGCSVGAVRTSIHRGLRALRASMPAPELSEVRP
ncbi:SigE family RNA polymerase sigma factor [Oryzihumus sp.]